MNNQLVARLRSERDAEQARQRQLREEAHGQHLRAVTSGKTS